MRQRNVLKTTLRDLIAAVTDKVPPLTLEQQICLLLARNRVSGSTRGPLILILFSVCTEVKRL